MSADSIPVVRGVHAYLDQVHARCAQDLDGSAQSARALVTEIVAEQAHVTPEQRLPRRFAQFMVCAWALTDAQEKGDLSACGDWVGWACARRPNSDHPCRLNLDQGWKPSPRGSACG